MVGPSLLPSLADVILRWRRHRFVIAADIEKMYRQILVHPQDRDLQRIIWRRRPEDELEEFQLNTVTYGLSSAPFLAMRTLRQLAIDESVRYPIAADALQRDVYMDDVLSGTTTLEEAQELQLQLSGLCRAGGFPLRKWSANDAAILSGIPEEHLAQREARAWQLNEAHSTLGLRWHPRTDDFSFTTSSISVVTFTKRSVLSLMARLFDPLGWLAPTVVGAKIAVQSTWLQGLAWDEPLDDVLAGYWRRFQDELPLLEAVRVPRWIGLSAMEDSMELHGFADASERAFAAVLYLRRRTGRSWRTTLLAAKTKVAPIKQVTLPRLELCAAVLLTRLATHLRTTLGLERTPLHCWTDSTVTLGWIKGHPTRWKTYVANRVAEIQTSAPDALWHHVPGSDNPADCASRGLSPGSLVRHELWWRGPPWLSAEVSAWRSYIDDQNKELPERRTLTFTTAITEPHEEEPGELLRFSSWHRLLRVTAWCRRWLRLRGNAGATGPASAQDEVGGTLSAMELEEARRLWIRRVQALKFKAELDALRQGRALKSSSKLTSLNPFSDAQGLLRVGGRLKHSLLNWDECNPVILPADSHLTRLVLEACHRRALHGGVQLTLSLARQLYWVPRGRALAKQVIQRCIACLRWRAVTPQQLMGSLPRERVTLGRPFLNTGVDYAGPIQLRTTKGRGHRSYRAFVVVFVCLSTRAVHLEVVSDYTADAFLAALRRFVSRRGLCNTIWSDCGTTFVGADRQLRDFRREQPRTTADHRRTCFRADPVAIQPTSSAAFR